jgi:hypothetical protein
MPHLLWHFLWINNYMVNTADKAFEIDAIIINDSAGIFSGGIDPSVTGFVASIGSLYLNTGGTLYKKTTTSDSGWVIVSDTGSTLADGYNGNITRVSNYNALDKVLIFVDTTNNSVTITLPTASTYVSKMFHIKWVATNTTGIPNKLILAAQTGETIDGETSQIYGNLYDSLEVVSDGATWFIV